MASTYAKLDVEKVLQELPVSDKVRLLAGRDFWHFHDVIQHGVPSIRVSDGPNGVRGQRFFNGVKANCFPASTGLGASFDVELASRVGAALGDEARAKGAHVLLGPTCNMQRSPLSGRGFESFAEDPHLSGMITSNYVKGVQSKGVAACVKHFVANDQEFERFSTDSIVAPRALREIYLEPFRLAVKHAHPLTFMSSYNRVNGIHVSESKQLLDDILRKEWGWDGLIMSDWTGTYSADTAIKAGLDVEMPGPTIMRGATIDRMIISGKLTLKDIDDRVRNLLNLANHAIASDIPFNAGEESINTPETRALLREAACSAHVLLKNSESLLPIKSAKKIAVIGANAKIAVPSGGGSAQLASTYTVSPLEGITAAAQELGATVEFANGASAFRYLPLLDGFMKNPRIKIWKDNFLEDWFKTPFDEATAPKPIFEEEITSSSGILIDGRIPYAELGIGPCTRISCEFTPDATGTYLVGIVSLGFSTVLINDEVVAENVESRRPGETFFHAGSEEQRGKIELEKGKTYKIEVRHWTDVTKVQHGPFSALPQAIGFQLGIYIDQPPEQARQEAVEVAKNSDLAIVVVGTNKDWEGEGFDRKDIILPGASDALVEAVLKANPRTIVVTQSGCPVAMPWIEQAPAVIQAFFGGNELGNALADVLFGKYNPCSKLPVTFPVRTEDNPSHPSFGITSPTPGQSHYTEGIFMGYRHYDRSRIAPLFPFGYGLSYTTFALSALIIAPLSKSATFKVSFKIRNTGSVAGRAVGQVYISAPSDRSVESPVKELVGFAKTCLLEPEQEETIEVQLEKEAFSYWDEEKDRWVATKGDYRVAVGENSNDLKLESSIKLQEGFEWKGL